MSSDSILMNDWHPVARSEDLSESKLWPARLLGEDLVLWRNDGQAMAWQDLCVHRGTRLSLGKIEGDTVVCPYHGWAYNPKGKCVNIPAHPEQTPPARACVKTYQVQERYNLVWVSLGDPQQDIPPFPEWGDPSYRKILCGPYGPFEASAPRAIENFLDLAHFPFVHTGSLGDPQFPAIPDYEVKVGSAGIETSVIPVYQPDPYGTGIGDTVDYTYRVYRPLTAYLDKTDKTGARFSIFFPITPHEETQSTAWMWIGLNQKCLATEEEFILFTNAIFGEDTPILSSQRPELLPLDLQAEMHLRCDRTSITYRKWLSEIGLTFGTA